MDFDDEENPKEVTKTRRFAPCRAGKSKPKPKPEPTAEKAEPSEFAGPKVNMEIDSKVNKEPEADLMEVDRIPLQEEEEEEDVVREIDVFFNPSIEANTKLYVLQYPLRPSWRPYEMDERCQEVRVNPSTSQVEFDLSMDVHSRNYDSEFGSKLQYMTKQTLTTTWKQPPTLDYAVGVLSGDELHLNPVHAVAQLRPSMHYLSSKKKQEEATQGSVETSKKQNWVSLKYHGLQSEFGSRYLNGMMANRNSSIDFNMSPLMFSFPLSSLETTCVFPAYLNLLFFSPYIFLSFVEVRFISTHCAVGETVNQNILQKATQGSMKRCFFIRCSLFYMFYLSDLLGRPN